MLPPLDWADIHWPAISRDDAARWIAVLPLAATEQHGPHLPLETDVMIGRRLYGTGARTAAAEHSRDISAHAAGRDFHRTHPFSGHADAADEAALRAWMGLGESVARAGIRKLVMVTSHGGNSAAMTIVAQDLRAHHGFSRSPPAGRASACRMDCSDAEELRHGIHGGAVETSIMLARYPQQVRHDAIADFRPHSIAMEKKYRWLSAHRPAPFAWQTQDLHPSGAAGDATQASAEKGERLLDHGARAFCELLADIDKFDPATLSNTPQS